MTVLNGQDAGADQQVQDAKELLDILLAEARKRLEDPKQIRKLGLSEILMHIEKILAAVKKNNVIVSKNFNVNLGKLHERVREIDSHPARRKEGREQIREDLRKLHGFALPPA